MKPFSEQGRALSSNNYTKDIVELMLDDKRPSETAAEVAARIL